MMRRRRQPSRRLRRRHLRCLGRRGHLHRRRRLPSISWRPASFSRNFCTDSPIHATISPFSPVHRTFPPIHTRAADPVDLDDLPLHTPLPTHHAHVRVRGGEHGFESLDGRLEVHVGGEVRLEGARAIEDNATGAEKLWRRVSKE